MDELLSEMRSAEERSHEGAWPTKFENKIEKKVSNYNIMTIFILNIIKKINKHMYSYSKLKNRDLLKCYS